MIASTRTGRHAPSIDRVACPSGLTSHSRWCISEHMSSASVRVGVDLVRVADVTASIARFGARYTERLFTAGERAYCDADVTRAPERYAARFAAKEATLKAFRPMPHDAVDPRSIEVRQLPEGACDIVLHDGAIALARRSGIVELSLSMSHEQEYATATVVACVAPLGATTRWPGPVNGTESVEETRSTSTSWDA